MNFLDELKTAASVTYTNNGAVVYDTTKNELLDFFSLGASLRGQPEKSDQLFRASWNVYPLLTLRCMFYFRDIREGQGERENFKRQLKILAKEAPEVVRKNLQLVPFFGRWDDLYCLINSDLEDDVFTFFNNQLQEDLKTETPSLLAKWLKSENTSSLESRRLGKITRSRLGLSSKQYRKTLSALRKKIKIVERLISSGRWDEIKYGHVPSRAMFIYRKAFMRHDEERFKQFIQKAASGETKINSKTLYPHEIVKSILQNSITPQEAMAMWDNLPDFSTNVEENAIAVVDVSGSMTSGSSSVRPIDVSISLGIYLSERAKGPYKDHFITFSEKPKIEKVEGNSIANKVLALSNAEWGYNTNIEAVFDLILQTAINTKASQDEMLDKLYIISDMQFDSATHKVYKKPVNVYGRNTIVENITKTLFQEIATKFEQHGYKMPNLVFWNVNGDSKFPMNKDERGFQNVCGFSQSILKFLMNDKFVGPIELMVEVLNSERYKQISI